MTLTQNIVDLILMLVAAECVALVTWLLRIGRRDMIAPLISFLVSGSLLLLVIRLTLADVMHHLLALSLLGLSFPIHITTLILVWKSLNGQIK